VTIVVVVVVDEERFSVVVEGLECFLPLDGAASAVVIVEHCDDEMTSTTIAQHTAMEVRWDRTMMSQSNRTFIRFILSICCCWIDTLGKYISLENYIRRLDSCD